MEELPTHLGFPLGQPGVKPLGQVNVKPGQQVAFEFEQNG